MRFETELVQFDAAPGDPYGPTVTPLYQTATFKRESFDEEPQYDYTRSGNPPRRVLEDHLAREEVVLFPAMIDAAGGAPAGDLGPVIAAMMADHDVIRGYERTLRGVSGLAGEHERALIALLDDLAVHAGREDEELFPAAAR